MLLTSCVSGFLGTCHSPVIIYEDIDILGFVTDGVIEAPYPVADGVIVTPEFIVKFREYAKCCKEAKSD